MSTNESDKENKPAEFEEAISLTGFGWYNVAMITVCGISLMSVIIETVNMSYIVPAAQCDLNLTLDEKGTLNSIGFLGVVTSSLLWGLIADTVGRKYVIIITSYISFLMDIASSLASEAWMLILFRFLNCFFIGGPSAVIIGYLGEFHSNSDRSRAITLSSTFVAFASKILPACAWIILSMNWSFYVPFLEITMRPWRLLIIVYGLPTVISATWLLFLPESPRYLWATNKSEEAMKVLGNMYSRNTGRPQSAYKVKYLVECNETTEIEKSNEDLNRSEKSIASFVKLLWFKLIQIFRPPLLYKTFIASTLQFGVFAGVNGILMWYPDIMNKILYFMDENPTESVTVCEALDFAKIKQNVSSEISNECSDTINDNVFIINFIVSVAFALTYIIIGIIIKHTGKKSLLLCLLITSGISALTINFMQSFVSIVIFSTIFIIGSSSGTIVNSAVVDLFPTKYRSIALSVTLMSGRIGAVIASQFFGYLLEYACFIVFYLCGFLYIALGIYAQLLPSEKKSIIMNNDA